MLILNPNLPNSGNKPLSLIRAMFQNDWNAKPARDVQDNYPTDVMTERYSKKTKWSKYEYELMIMEADTWARAHVRIYIICGWGYYGVICSASGS